MIYDDDETDAIELLRHVPVLTLMETEMKLDHRQYAFAVTSLCEINPIYLSCWWVPKGVP